MEKKLRVFFLLFVLLFSAALPVYAAEGEKGNLFMIEEEGQNPVIYGDIENHWVKGAAESLYNMGALPYQEESNFLPDKPITRAELLYILITVKGISPTDKRQLPYDDLQKDAWYTPYVETAYQIGLIDGKGKKYYPSAPLSRQNLIDIVIRSLGEGMTAQKYGNLKSLTKFKDGFKIDPPFRSIMAYAVDKGYIRGDASKEIRPLSDATRAEAIGLIYKTLYPQLAIPELKKEEVGGIPILYFQKVNVQATAYSSEEKGISHFTALGWNVREGIVSVDPAVIPYGTHLYIPGYGYAVAADRGGEVKELKVDLYVNSLAKARKYGIKKNLPVYVLDPVKISVPSK